MRVNNAPLPLPTSSPSQGEVKLHCHFSLETTQLVS